LEYSPLSGKILYLIRVTFPKHGVVCHVGTA